MLIFYNGKRRTTILELVILFRNCNSSFRQYFVTIFKRILPKKSNFALKMATKYCQNEIK